MSSGRNLSFADVLIYAEAGWPIRRFGWSLDPREETFRHDLVVYADGRLLSKHHNSYSVPALTLTDYRTNDWMVCVK
jgi:hypothetical protein